MSSSPRRIKRWLHLEWHRSAAIAVCAVVGMILPMAFGFVAGIPEPAIHDEFAYLLGAETFAKGRLANPSPELPEFFESPHVLVTPTYSSKYPAGQSLVLALGLLLAGHAIWGVWLSCGLFAASLCWMLQAWTSRPWALATTLTAIATLGVASYWAQSYWGGMLGATGSALLFGGLRRTLRGPRLWPSLAMGLGVVLLAYTRPYEGSLVCLAVCPVLVGWLVSRRTQFRTALRKWVLPFGLVVGTGAMGIVVNNRAVTKEWLTTPYLLHTKQYLGGGLFVFNSPRDPDRTPLSRLASLYDMFAAEPGRPVRWLPRTARYFWIRLTAAIESALGVDALATRPAREQYGSVLLWVASLILATQLRSRWVWFCAGALVFVVVGQSLVKWWIPHYASPLVPLVLATIAMAFRGLGWNAGRRARRSRLAPAFVAMLAIAFVFVTFAREVRADPAPIEGPDVSVRTVLARFVAARKDVIRRVTEIPGPHLVFVSYARSYPLGQEWVYNPADFESARVLFAHDLGADKNRELIAVHPHRTIWTVRVTPEKAILERLASK